MNTRILFAAAFTGIVALSTGSAIASDTNIDFASSPASSLSRVEVLGALITGHASGQVANGESNVVTAQDGPALTRPQVKAETLAAIRLGAISRRERSAGPSLHGPVAL